MIANAAVLNEEAREAEASAPEVAPPPPAASAERFGPARGRRRIRLAQEVVLEIQALRPTLQEALREYERRMTGQITELLLHLQGDGPAPRVPAARTSAAMLQALRASDVKPRKGRAKDLVRLQELVAELTELLPPRDG